MSLSTELISQFVQVSNEEKNDKAEDSILYGTIVSHGDALYVKMDGSTELTPMVNTATVKPGERVSVTIKNHTAIVTGNLTDPSASSAELHGITTSTELIELLIEDISLTVNKHGVAFKGLEDGTTVINGGCIKTGRIDAQYINLTGAISFEDLTKELQDEIGSVDLPSYIKNTYIGPTTIQSPTIEGNDISVYGTFQTYYGDDITGYMGAATGKDYYGNDTLGVALSSSPIDNRTPKLNYIIVTNGTTDDSNGGCRIQAGQNRITVTDKTISITTSESGGKAYYNNVELGTAVFG